MDLLFLCAHPDDLEFYIGYILFAIGYKNKIGKGKRYISKRYPQKPINYKIASLTRGEMSDFTIKIQSTLEAARIRTKELENALNELGCDNLDFLGFFDGYIRINETSIERIKNYIQKIKPDIIIAPEPVFTWYHHRDHKNTGKLVYYAIKRWQKEDPNSQKPLIYYYTALFHHYFFPKFSEWRPFIQNALLKHESQFELLKLGRIPDFIMSILNGLRVYGFRYAQALRRQYRPDIDPKRYKQLLMKKWSLTRRILYYCLKNILKSFDKMDYSNRYPYIDGTIKNSVYLPLIPDLSTKNQ